jgi:glycosyltransferase involved in cell wall biosynthesis
MTIPPPPRPVVSVLMCTDRDDTFLPQAIQSILAQTLDRLELVLVCNGDALPIVERLARTYESDGRVTVLGSRIRYLTSNLNIGLAACRAERVARMDADDLAHPRRLELQATFLDANPEVGVCGTWYDLIDGDNRKVATVRRPCDDAGIRKMLFSTNPFCHSSVMFRRRLVAEAGGYMGGIYAEDYDLWTRLAISGLTRFANLDEPLLGYRAAPTGSARKARRAYSSAAASQVGAFLESGDPRWLAGAIRNAAKRAFQRR